MTEQAKDDYAELFTINQADVAKLYEPARVDQLARLQHFDLPRYVQFQLDRQMWRGIKMLWKQVDKRVGELDKAHAAATKEAAKERRKEAAGEGTYPVNAEDQLALARLVIEERAPHLVHTSNSWLDWKGTHYGELEPKAMRRMVYQLLARCIDAETGEPLFPNEVMVNRVLDALVSESLKEKDLYQPPTWLWHEEGDKPAHEYLPCANVLLHLPTGETQPLTPRLFTYTALDFEYWPPEFCDEPREWLYLLNTMWPNEPDSIEALQEVMGYFLTADTVHQNIFILVGPPRAGKGVVGRVIKTMLGGSRNVASPSVKSVAGQFGKAALIGKALWMVPELRIGRNTDITELISVLLSISGRDSVGVERKHQENWDGQLDARVFMMTNRMLQLPDESGALMRRLFTLVTEHSQKPGTEDLTLADRIIDNEMPAILNWAIEGWRRLKARGRFKLPESGRLLNLRTAAYTASVQTFLAECCDIGDGKAIPTALLHQAYEAWNEHNDIGRSYTDSQFGRDLPSASGFRVKRTRPRVGDHGQQVPHYDRVALKAGMEWLLKEASIDDTF